MPVQWEGTVQWSQGRLRKRGFQTARLERNTNFMKYAMSNRKR